MHNNSFIEKEKEALVLGKEEYLKHCSLNVILLEDN